MRPGLKTLDDAFEIRRRILLAFEAAEKEPDPARRARLADLRGHRRRAHRRGDGRHAGRDRPPHAARRVPPHRSRQRPHPPAGRRLARAAGHAGRPEPARAANSWKSWACEVRLDALVTGHRRRAAWKCKPAGAPGAAPHELHHREPLRDLGRRRRGLAARAGSWRRPRAPRRDRAGRVVVEPDLSLPGHPEISVIGDLAAARSFAPGQEPQPVPGVSPAAKQMGRAAAANLLRRLAGRPTQPFRYRDYGNLATIGRNAAVVDLTSPLGRFKFSGYSGLAVLAVRAHLFPDRISQPHRGADRLGFGLLEQAALRARRHRHRRRRRRRGASIRPGCERRCEADRPRPGCDCTAALLLTGPGDWRCSLALARRPAATAGRSPPPTLPIGNWLRDHTPAGCARRRCWR